MHNSQSEVGIRSPDLKKSSEAGYSAQAESHTEKRGGGGITLPEVCREGGGGPKLDIVQELQAQMTIFGNELN